MKCTDAKPLFSAMLDAEINGKQMRDVNEHLDGCDTCRAEFSLLRNTQLMVASMRRKPAPPDLALKLRVMISQEIAASRRKPWDGLFVRWQNALRAFMVPATAGALSAVVIFGLLIGVLMPGQFAGTNDVPTVLYTPPELASSPFGFEIGTANEDALVIEAYVDANGRVQDYRVLSGSEEAKEISPELKNMLIFTTFRPATSFGQPISGRAVLTFSKISVKG